MKPIKFFLSEGVKKISSKEKTDKSAFAGVERKDSSADSSSPPPGYVDAPPEYDAEDTLDPPDITAGFSKLHIGQPIAHGKPTVAQCIAHLKLLECFYRLRQTVGSTDRLFGIDEKAVLDSGVDKNEQTPELLAKLGEKRWAVYVACAVDRFAAWSAAVAPSTGMMTMAQLEQEGPKGTLCEPNSAPPPLEFDANNVPPVDVLMVWHSYMLNPRAYLEDCLRHGRMQLWHTRFPWQAAADCIDSETFAYEASMMAESIFASLTGCSWDSVASTRGKEVQCPGCDSVQTAKWTTCSEHVPTGVIKSYDELSVAIDSMLASGHGFCDKDFSLTCSCCSTNITHERLEADKFCSDVKQLVKNTVPMSGTILGPDGIPFTVGSVTDFQSKYVVRTTNGLLREGLGDKIVRGARIGEGKCTTESMEAVRDMIQLALKDKGYLQKIRGIATPRMSRGEKVAIRKMMSRYWDNSCSFALDLVGAVIRQGSFVEKMHNIDWLHSPALPSTMARLITKYDRFMSLMSDKFVFSAVYYFPNRLTLTIRTKGTKWPSRRSTLTWRGTRTSSIRTRT